jgi:hypothetical protein
MRKDCSGSGGSLQGRDIERVESPEHIGAAISRLFEGVMRMTAEMEKELAKIRECPEPCGDGAVEIVLSSGQKRRLPCPVIKTGTECEYARDMARDLGRHVRSVMAAAGIPLRHIENFARYYPLPEPEEAKKWPVRGFLIIGGGHGTGKSFCAARMLFNYLKRQVKNPFDRSSWENADRAGNALMWGTAMEIADDRETALRAKKASLAVIDDLGGESDASASLAALRGVILRRYDMKLPTVITTILTMPDIAFRYGGGITDRLTEDMGDGGRIIDCGSALIRNVPGRSGEIGN